MFISPAFDAKTIRPDSVSSYMGRSRWTHERMMEAHRLRKLGYSLKTAARMALLGWGRA